MSSPPPVLVLGASSSGKTLLIRGLTLLANNPKFHQSNSHDNSRASNLANSQSINQYINQSFDQPEWEKALNISTQPTVGVEFETLTLNDQSNDQSNNQANSTKQSISQPTTQSHNQFILRELGGSMFKALPSYIDQSVCFIYLINAADQQQIALSNQQIQIILQSINQSNNQKPFAIVLTHCDSPFAMSITALMTLNPYLSINQSINETINQSANPTHRQSIHQSINRSNYQSDIPCMYTGTIKSINQSNSQSNNQVMLFESCALDGRGYVELLGWIRQSINQSINQSNNQTT